MYAVLNEQNKCIAVTNFTTGENNYILIEDEKLHSTYFLNKYYDSTQKIFYQKTEPNNEDLMNKLLQLDKIEEQVYSNNENNIILMEAMADQYEQTEQYRINDMEVQATIFETVLALSGGGTAV